MKLLIRFILLQIMIYNLVNADPIRLNPDNGHYFLFRGKPIILITSGEHYGSVINLDFNYIKYLNTLYSSGLNYTRILTGSYVESTKSFGIEKNTLAPGKERVIVPWARSNVPGYINGGNKFDLDKWDPDYFKRLKDFVFQAGKHEIIVEVTLFSSIYTDNGWAYSPLNLSNNINHVSPLDWENVHTLNNGELIKYQENLVRKIVRELNEYDNVFYEIQNEPWSDQTVIANILNPYDKDSYKSWFKRSDLASEESLEWQKTIASFIKDEETKLKYQHLIAQNYCNFHYPVKEKDISPYVSILNFHYAWPEAVILNYGWDIVISFDESGFAGKEDKTYRKQAWNFILSGGGVFNHLDYSFAVGHEDGTFENYTSSPGGGSINLRSQIKVLKDFICSFDFIRLKPNNLVIKKAPGVFTRAMIEVSKQYAIYVDGGNQCKLELELPKGKYKVDWINTKNGNIEKTEIFSPVDNYIILTSPIYIDDIALRIIRSQN